MAKREIIPGQKYHPTGSTAAWEVREVVQDAEGISHARLVRVGDPTTVKTISVTALKDNRLFRPLPDQTA